MESADTWHAKLSEGCPIRQDYKRRMLILYTEAGKKDVLEVFRTFQEQHDWQWNQVTDDISLLGRAIGRNHVEVVKYLMGLSGVDKSKCGIRKYGRCYMNPIMQCLLMAETRDTRLMLIAILQATTAVGAATDVNFVRRDGISCLEQALMLKHPEYSKILLRREDLNVNTIKLGETPLRLAIRYNRPTHTQHLLNDKRVSVKGIEPEPPIITAASCLMTTYMKMVIGAGGDTNGTYLDPWVQKELDAYHINIRQCLYMRLPSHLSEKVQMAIILLNGGYTRKINRKQINRMIEESTKVSAPPLPVQLKLIDTLVELPRKRVCPLKYQARTCIVKRLRTKNANNITHCMQTLIRSQNLPIGCQNCLKFQ